MRALTSWKISERRSVWLTWLAIWNSRLFWPPNQIGTTVAFERWISCETKGCQRESTAGLRPSRSGAVETAPAGKHDDDAAALELRARGRARGKIGLPRLLRLGKVDRQDEVAHLGRAHQHRVGQHDEIGTHLLDQPGNDDAVEHAIGMIGDDDDRTRLRHARERRAS